MEVPSSSYINSLLRKYLANDANTEDNDEFGEIYLINNLEKFFTSTVREIMVPRIQMATIDQSRPIGEAIELILESGHSRIPAQDGEPDNIVGILHAIDLFKYFNSTPEIPVSEVMRKPFFASYFQPIHQLLSNFKKSRIQLAIVVDEHGGVDGLVTIEDIIEELVGDIPDEFSKDDKPGYSSLENGSLSMDASFPLDEFNQLCGADFHKEGIETIGGYLCHTSGKIPKEGEKMTLENIDFKVQKSDERRLLKLIIDPSEIQPE